MQFRSRKCARARAHAVKSRHTHAARGAMSIKQGARCIVWPIAGTTHRESRRRPRDLRPWRPSASNARARAFRRAPRFVARHARKRLFMHACTPRSPGLCAGETLRVHRLHSDERAHILCSNMKWDYCCSHIAPRHTHTHTSV